MTRVFARVFVMPRSKKSATRVRTSNGKGEMRGFFAALRMTAHSKGNRRSFDSAQDDTLLGWVEENRQRQKQELAG